LATIHQKIFDGSSVISEGQFATATKTGQLAGRKIEPINKSNNANHGKLRMHQLAHSDRKKNRDSTAFALC
jgi:hypothetical protein